MNRENSSEKKIVRVSSKKWDRTKSAGEHVVGNNVKKNGVTKENAIETEEEVVDPYTKKRRESLKNDVYDMAGKVRTNMFIISRMLGIDLVNT